MPTPVIDTILPTLADSLIVGPPRAGKTRAALHEIACLLSRPFLATPPKVYGRFAMDPDRAPTNIVFISAETGKHELQILFQAAVKALGIDPPRIRLHLNEHFQWFSQEAGCDCWFYPDPEVIIAKIRGLRFRPDIIYVDALTDVCPHCEKPDIESDFIRSLRHITRTCGGFVWRFIHHTNAQRKEAGGFPLKAWARHKLRWTRTACDIDRGTSAYDVTAESHWHGTKSFALTMRVHGPTLQPETISYSPREAGVVVAPRAGLPTHTPIVAAKIVAAKIVAAIDGGDTTIKAIARRTTLTEKYVRDTINKVLIPSGQVQVDKTDGRTHHYGRTGTYRLTATGRRLG